MYCLWLRLRLRLRLGMGMGFRLRLLRLRLRNMERVGVKRLVSNSKGALWRSAAGRFSWGHRHIDYYLRTAACIRK